MDNVTQEFERLGKQASFHYAAEGTGEWRLGSNLEQKARALFKQNPALQDEMREIAKGFLWTLGE